jgi:ribosomal-protein-alanine N-acetyltransferase
VRIRPGVADDIPAILKIERRTKSGTHWAEEKYREIFEREIPRRIVLVAEDESGVQGFGIIRLLHQECEVENLVIATDRRRQGTGRQLLCRLIDLAYNQGATEVFLEVRESNTPARALYNKFGFTQGGRRKLYYHNPEEDAILYRLHFQNEGPPGMARQPGGCP